MNGNERLNVAVSPYLGAGSIALWLGKALPIVSSVISLYDSLTDTPDNNGKANTRTAPKRTQEANEQGVLGLTATGEGAPSYWDEDTTYWGGQKFIAQASWLAEHHNLDIDTPSGRDVLVQLCRRLAGGDASLMPTYGERWRAGTLYGIWPNEEEAWRQRALQYVQAYGSPDIAPTIDPESPADAADPAPPPQTELPTMPPGTDITPYGGGAPTFPPFGGGGFPGGVPGTQAPGTLGGGVDPRAVQIATMLQDPALRDNVLAMLGLAAVPNPRLSAREAKCMAMELPKWMHKPLTQYAAGLSAPLGCTDQQEDLFMALMISASGLDLDCTFCNCK